MLCSSTLQPPSQDTCTANRGVHPCSHHHSSPRLDPQAQVSKYYGQDTCTANRGVRPCNHHHSSSTRLPCNHHPPLPSPSPLPFSHARQQYPCHCYNQCCNCWADCHAGSEGAGRRIHQVLPLVLFAGRLGSSQSAHCTNTGFSSSKLQTCGWLQKGQSHSHMESSLVW